MPERSHPLEGLMKTTMESIKDMVDVNTILGDPVETPDGTVIIPISRVAFGFAAGGSEYESEREISNSKDSNKSKQKCDNEKENGNGNGNGHGNGNGKANHMTVSSVEASPGPERYPFGGGSGAGISLQPVAFLVVGQGGVRLLPVDQGALWNRLIDMAPGVIDSLKSSFAKANNSNETLEPEGCERVILS